MRLSYKIFALGMKLHYCSLSNLKNVLNLFFKKKTKNVIFFKNLFIINLDINKNIYVYNGFSFKKLLIVNFYRNYRYGNFIFTRKIFKFNKKVKIKR